MNKHEYLDEPREKLMPLPEVFVWTRFGTEAGQPIEEIIERFGKDTPDGARVVVASRIDNFDPGCP